MLHQIAGDLRQILVEQGLIAIVGIFRTKPFAGMTKEILDRHFCNVRVKNLTKNCDQVNMSLLSQNSQLEY